MVLEIMDLWCLVVLIVFVSTKGVYSQADSNGFISIDCGLDANSSTDSETMLTYTSDDGFIDTGENHNISPKYAASSLANQYLNVRSFLNGIRNCYTLKSLTVESKYFVRAKFMYGNYDNLNEPPTFDIHLGANYWTTISLTSADEEYFSEIIAVATADYLEVCLINTGLGTPFISCIEMRPLLTSMYPQANSTQSLVYYDRMDLGASTTAFLPAVRYPDDPYDRSWRNFTYPTWEEISSSSTVQPDQDYEIPSVVLETAAATSSTNESLDVLWQIDNESIEFLVVLHICEIEDVPRTALREFNILINGYPVLNHSYKPDKLYAGWFFYYKTGHTPLLDLSLQATANSTLPPLLNALELYKVNPLTEVPTYSNDVTVVNIIKENYQVRKGWSGDPCVPANISWTGVNCTFHSAIAPRITSLNLSSSGLTGAIVSSFGNLTALKSLDLSNNNLSGALPTSLDQLVALTYLDISGNNNISNTLPPGLQIKEQNGSLIYKFEATTPIPSIKKKKSSVVLIAVAGVVGLVVLLLIIMFILKRHKRNQVNISKQNENLPRPNGVEGMLNFENRRFSYKDLKKITNNFQRSIGAGGFGGVYAGFLENGTQVAVKKRSQSSSQGVKEFLAEAQNLTRVHHRNLVSLIGYCMDGDCMALVYEYMPEGTLQDKLIDNANPLTWKQRLRIVYQSALGLEYLHKACNPPLIHRDVKTNNILLNANLEAKLADFGLSRAFNNDTSSHVSTAIVGTPGYLDPEYYSSFQLSEKSDVFSFGVVLLEIVTGQPPIITGPEGGHVAKWARQNLLRGDIESIVDPRMHGQYDINSVWKVTDLACNCTEHSSARRPTMNVVVSELKESLDLEISTENTTSTNLNNYSRNDNIVSDVSQNSAFDMVYMLSISGSGPVVR